MLIGMARLVVTPNPHTHALLADKRNLTLLSDPVTLEKLDVELNFVPD